jgi:tellurite resistance protein
MSRIDKSALSGLGEDKLEALVEMMYLAACADGEFSADERAHFSNSVQSLTDGRLTAARLEALIAQAEKELGADGRDGRLQAVKARLPDAAARRVALSLAIEMAAADGIVRTSERELIMETAEALEIDRDAAADLVARLTT